MATTAKEKKVTVYTQVKMEDGSTVDFAGNRKVQKTVVVDEAAETVKVRFDHLNGRVIEVDGGALSQTVLLRLIGHGLSQKVGDNSAGETDIDDIVLSHETMVEQLMKGEWGIARTAGDSMAGASILIRAICEVTKKTKEEVKAFLQAKLDTAKKAEAAGGAKALTRQALYASFRDPKSKVGQVVKRMEEEDAAKSAGTLNSDDLLGELEGAPQA